MGTPCGVSSMNIRKSKGKKRGLFDRLRKIPHLFAKIIIVHCILVVTIAAYYSLWAQKNGADMVAIYTAIAATFVSELCMLLLKTLFKKDGEEKEDDTNETDVDEPSI